MMCVCSESAAQSRVFQGSAQVLGAGSNKVTWELVHTAQCSVSRKFIASEQAVCGRYFGKQTHQQTKQPTFKMSAGLPRQPVMWQGCVYQGEAARAHVEKDAGPLWPGACSWLVLSRAACPSSLAGAQLSIPWGEGAVLRLLATSVKALSGSGGKNWNQEHQHSYS